MTPALRLYIKRAYNEYVKDIWIENYVECRTVAYSTSSSGRDQAKLGMLVTIVLVLLLC